MCSHELMSPLTAYICCCNEYGLTQSDPAPATYVGCVTYYVLSSGLGIQSSVFWSNRYFCDQKIERSNRSWKRAKDRKIEFQLPGWANSYKIGANFPWIPLAEIRIHEQTKLILNFPKSNYNFPNCQLILISNFFCSLKGQSNKIFDLHFCIIRICLSHWPTCKNIFDFG